MMFSAWTLNLSFFRIKKPPIQNLPEALQQGQLDTSRGTRKIQIGNQLHSIESVVDQVDSLHGDHLQYSLASKEYHRIMKADQRGTEQSCCTLFANLFSCFRWTTACKEQEILKYGALSEEGVVPFDRVVEVLKQELGLD